MLNRRDFFISAGQAAPPKGFWLHVNRTAMACRFEVTLPGSESAGVEVARQALDEIDELEGQLTVFRETSEVSFVNRQAALRPVQIEKSLFDLLILSKQLYRDTDRAFDVTAGPLSRCWGFMRRQGRLPEASELEQLNPLIGSDKVILDEPSRTVRFAWLGMEINFGGIGKGYALDRVAIRIRERVCSALLSAGSSSMRAIGAGDAGHSGWVVGIRHPRKLKHRLAVLRIRDCAMSTSGSEEQFFELNGKRFGHIIDPRSGQPAEGVSSVTVVAPSAAETDALSTAFYVGGSELAARYCDNHPGTLAILLERNAERAMILGSNPSCEVNLIDG